MTPMPLVITVSISETRGTSATANAVHTSVVTSRSLAAREFSTNRDQVGSAVA